MEKIINKLMREARLRSHRDPCLKNPIECDRENMRLLGFSEKDICILMEDQKKSRPPQSGYALPRTRTTYSSGDPVECDRENMRLLGFSLMERYAATRTYQFIKKNTQGFLRLLLT